MPSFPVPDGPHNDDWRFLLPLGFAVAEEIRRKHGVDFDLVLGGGSMLLRRYRHRRSRDLDLFVTDVRLVRWASPRFNDVASDLFPDYSEEATAVKLVIGMQEIDIIAAAPVVQEDATEREVIGGREVLVERPREILAKKVAYRGRNFQPRDVFDLACVAEAEPGEVGAVLPWLSPTHLDDLDARLDELAPTLEAELGAKVDPYPEFAHLAGACLDVVRGVVAEWRRALKPRVDVPPFPRGSHKPFFSRDGLTVVIREWDEAKRRFDRIGNPLGPALVGPHGAAFFLGGRKMSEDEWRADPRVSAVTVRNHESPS